MRRLLVFTILTAVFLGCANDKKKSNTGNSNQERVDSKLAKLTWQDLGNFKFSIIKSTQPEDNFEFSQRHVIDFEKGLISRNSATELSENTMFCRAQFDFVTRDITKEKSVLTAGTSFIPTEDDLLTDVHENKAIRMNMAVFSTGVLGSIVCYKHSLKDMTLAEVQEAFGSYIKIEKR